MVPPMRPTPPTWRALVSLTVRQIGTIFGTRVGAEFLHGKTLGARFSLPGCEMANRLQQA
jgi:hypothetical protein